MLRFFEPASQDYYNNLTRTLGGPNSRTVLHNFDDHNQDKVLGIQRDYKYFNRFCYESSLNQIPGEESLTARSTYSRIFGFAQLDTRMKIQSNNSLVRHQTINEETVTGRKCKRLKGELYNNVKLQNIPFSIPPTEKKLGDETAKKVKRSQKLGDKITALQQLVSPYGKTDTASVLLEASVYIKTLHDQIRELSLYHFAANPSLQGNGGGMISLDRRRLCLVPASSILTHSTNQQPVINSSSRNI